MSIASPLDTTRTRSLLFLSLSGGERLLDKKSRSYISSGSDSQITLSTVRPLPVASLGFPSVPANLTAEDTRPSFPILTPAHTYTRAHSYNLREAEAGSIPCRSVHTATEASASSRLRGDPPKSSPVLVDRKQRGNERSVHFQFEDLRNRTVASSPRANRPATERPTARLRPIATEEPAGGKSPRRGNARAEMPVASPCETKDGLDRKFNAGTSNPRSSLNRHPRAGKSFVI